MIKKAPTGATNYTYVTQALANLKKAGIDVNGASYKPITVKVTPGGK